MTLVAAADAPAHPNRDALEELFHRDSLAASMGAVLDDWGAGWARVRWTPGPAHRNFAGTVHGGALVAVADVAFAVACNSWGRAAVALQVDTHFLDAASPGDELVAAATERSRSRRTGSYQIDVHAGPRHVVGLHALAYRTSTWHLGQDAWPTEWQEIA